MGKANHLFMGDTVGLIRDFFNPVINDKELLKEYEDKHYETQILNVRIGHFFASLIFVGFGVFDFFTFSDQDLFFQLNIVRLAIFIFVLVPFNILSFSPNFINYTRAAIFLTYLVFGGFISYAVYVLDSDKSTFTNNYYALDLIILAVFLMLTIKLKDALILSFLLIGMYNLVWVNNIMNNSDYVSGLLDVKFFINFNIWLITVVFSGSMLWKYNQNNSKKNFLFQKDLNRQKVEIKKSNDIKNKFFSLLTHDLKNLIGSQYSLTSCLVDNFDEMSTGKKKEFIDILGGASTRTLKVFDELTLWVQAQTHQIQVKPELIPLKKIIHEIEEQVSIELKDKDVKLVNQVADGIEVYCDLNSLKTVMRNLLGNALKFSYPNHKIYINARIVGSEVEVVVVDEGVGMSQQTIESLFLIDKAKSSLGTDGEKGTGLGLILSKELLELNKGRIWADAKERAGTYMYFTMPKTKPLKA